MTIDSSDVFYGPEGGARSGCTPYSVACASGVDISIKAATIGDDDSIALRVIGTSSRVMLGISLLEPKNASTAVYPQEIRWAIGVGTACVIDRRQHLSGPVPDLMTIVSKSDARIGTLYHVGNMLVGQWVLFAALPPGSSAWRARISVVVDHFGSGGEVALWKGGVFG